MLLKCAACFACAMALLFSPWLTAVSHSPAVTLRVARHFNETNDDVVRLSVTVPIPVFDQNQGNILSARESLAKTRAEREANRNTLLVVAGKLTNDGGIAGIEVFDDAGVQRPAWNGRSFVVKGKSRKET